MASDPRDASVLPVSPLALVLLVPPPLARLALWLRLRLRHWFTCHRFWHIGHAKRKLDLSQWAHCSGAGGAPGHQSPSGGISP